MAHELEIIGGEASMAYTGSAPWHSLGQLVDPNSTPLEMQVAANLDWLVQKIDSFVEFEGDRIKTGTQALIRTNDHKVLSPNVGPDWEPVQNHEAFDFFADFVHAGDMSMETAGSLKGGKIVWALAKIKDSFTLFGGDTVNSYLLFSNSHMYGKSTIVDFTPIRVVCNNTLTMALNAKSKHSVTINHRAKFDSTRVKELLGVATTKLQSYKEAAEFLGSKQTERDTLMDYFKDLFPLSSDNLRKAEMSKNAEIAMDVMQNQPGAKFAEGSWWQAYNAFTYMTDHLLCRDADTRVFHSWFGGHKQKKIVALNLAIEYAEAA